MRLRTACLAALAAAAPLSLLPPAQAREPEVHVLTIPLPGGGVQEIRYTGPLAPQVTVLPAPVALTPDPFLFGPGAPFSLFQQVSQQMALMQQRMDSLLRQAATLAPQPGAHDGLMAAGLGGDGVCIRSMRITLAPGQAQPQVVTSSAGHCGPAPEATPPAATRARSPAPHQPGQEMLRWASTQPGQKPPRLL